MKTGLIAALATSFTLLSMVSCGKEFMGLSTKKKTETKPTLSPPETEPTRKSQESPKPKEDFPIETKVLPQGIALHVVATDSESWWKNCLFARTPYGDDWVFVSCNKGGGPGSVTLAGLQGACTEIEIRVDIFRNVGETCNINARNGLPCNGPYDEVPDWSVVPESDAGFASSDKSSPFSVIDSSNVRKPDPLIRANSGWSLPDFGNLESKMKAWSKNNVNNKWLRAFFEDQAPQNIQEARRAPLESPRLGVDYNDYVFDIKTENLAIGIKDANGSIGCDN